MPISVRRLRQSALISINGVGSTPLTWAGAHFGPGSAEHSLQVLGECDVFLMGRRTYEIFVQQWPGASGEYAEALNAIPKYVFSSKLESAAWSNTTVVRGDVAAAVAALKSRPGRDLLMYGHGRLGQALLEAGLIDELTLNVVPVFAEGEPLFPRERRHSPGSWQRPAPGRILAWPG
jgi:dihydrofolate reductase